MTNSVSPFDIHENPSESINWRQHRSGCPNYRERWLPLSDTAAGEPMYQVFCLLNTPPQTGAEQEKCLGSRSRCWRHAARATSAANATNSCDIPLSSVRRRKPA